MLLNCSFCIFNHRSAVHFWCVTTRWYMPRHGTQRVASSLSCHHVMSGLLSTCANCYWLLLLLSAVDQRACVADKQTPRRHEAVNRCTSSRHRRCTAVSTKAQLQRLVCTAGPRKYYAKDADSKLAVLWLILVQPLLFGAIGIEIDFRQIQGSLIWKTVIILALGITQP